jgi:peptide/nickel transport system substrate-binding protein
MKKRVRAVLWTVAAGLCSLGMAGCPPGERQSAGAELRFGFTTEPATLDPLNAANTADGRSILFNVFEGLVKVAPNGDLAPAAAESWVIERGGLVYTFTLREKLVFHDGSAVTPADVVFSLQSAVHAGFSGFGGIAGIEAVGNREVRITLKAPDPEFIPYLTIAIVPRDNPDRERRPIGTGPFKVASYTTQQSMVLTKNPDYWREGFPKLDRVTIVFLADSNALLLALQGGNIDGAVVTGSLLQQLSPDSFDVVSGYSNMVQLLALNNAVPPLNNRTVRQALNYAVDVEEIIGTAFYGHGEPSGSPLIPGITRAYETSLRNPYPVDRDQAKTLLAEAGYPNGFNLEITVPSNYTMHIDTAQVIVNQLARIGVNASIRLVDWGAWISEVYQGRRYEATIISLDGNTVSPQAFLYRYQSTQGSNFISFNSAAFDRVYRQALDEPDEERRIAGYKAAQRIISDEAASVYIQDIFSFWVYRKGSYSGAETYPIGVTDFAPVRRTPPPKPERVEVPLRTP